MGREHIHVLSLALMNANCVLQKGAISDFIQKSKKYFHKTVDKGRKNVCVPSYTVMYT